MSIALASQGLSSLAPIVPQTATEQAPANGFTQVLQSVNSILEQADQMAAGYAQGKVGLTEAVLASEKADVTFQLAIAVRNRALSAYQEIMSLQV
ncbi:MAG TPA: flagellar hook-basal body complex protein FliE [Candidatus Binataceae bacterium]|nr:flagellar hook-basal body complex protein FliE [Candidatus Binataceae bacterium]